MKLAAENSSPDELTRQMMEDLDIIDYVDDPSIEGDSVKLSDRTLNAQEWLNIQKGLLQEYFTHTGENVAADAHGNNQHTYEVQSKGDNKFRRATSKRTQRQAEISQCIDIIMSIAKQNGNGSFAGVDIVSVNINEVDIRKEFEIEEKVEKLLNLKLISKVQALMKVEGVDEATAINLLSSKDKHDKLFEEEPILEPQAKEPIEGEEENGDQTPQTPENNPD